MYDLVVTTSAKNQIKRLNTRYQKSAIEALKDLRIKPKLGKPLLRELKGKFSFQFGPYRMICKINKNEKRVEALAVKHRNHACG